MYGKKPTFCVRVCMWGGGERERKRLEERKAEQLCTFQHQSNFYTQKKLNRY